MLRAPEPLAVTHAITAFDSGVPSLDEWLRRRALQNQLSMNRPAAGAWRALGEMSAKPHPDPPRTSGRENIELMVTACGRQRPWLLGGASRTFVLCADAGVVGYYALAASAVAVSAAPGRFSRNMPDPIPVVVLARLAISRARHGQGLGRALFADAARRVIQSAAVIGVRGLLVHAISEEARAFYLRLGLVSSPTDPMTLMTTVSALQTALAAPAPLSR